MPIASPGLRQPVLLLLALAAAIHAPFIGGGFLTDDFLHLARLERQTIAGVLVSPDTFGFYRPLPQASLLANLYVAGADPWWMRATNLLIHAAVIWAAHGLGRLLLGSERGALFATLAFILTPKAHPIAVLWISARAELLMALFSLVALICWIRWQREERFTWLAGAWASYLLALGCKETAVLLPVLMVFTPPGCRSFARGRMLALAGMLSTAGVVFAGRLQIGALMPVSSDAHYDLSTPFWRWLRNGRNYFGRAIVSPLSMVAITGAARFSGWTRSVQPDAKRILRLSAYAGLWYVVFILPVLPIAARSEHYLYLPVLGWCLLAGAVVERLLAGCRNRDPVCLAALAIYVAMVGGFEVSRAAALRADAAFSEKLLTALRQHPAIAQHRGSVVLIPANDEVRRYFQDAIGGYVGAAMDRALGRHVPAGFGNPGSTHEPDALLLTCAYVDGELTLHPGRP